MNIFKKLVKKFNLSLTDPKAWDRSLWSFAGSQSLSGETVNEYTAFTYSAVWNAIYQISSTIGSLPLHLMQRTGRNKRYAIEQSLYRVLHTQWNPYMTAKTGRETMAAHILSWGNGYAEKVKNGYGDIIELWPIAPDRVTPEMQDGEIVYIIMVGNEKKTFNRDKILHIPGFGFDGLVGYSPIAMARKNIGWGMAMETFSSNYFGQGTHPGVVVSHPGKLDPDAFKNLKQSLTDNYSGLGQSHKLMLLEDAMKLEKLGFSPEDSQFLESKQHHISDIARWFNMPPHKLKDMTKSSFNNIEAENASYVIDTILPWIVHIEQNYAIQLLTLQEYKQGFYFKHILEGLLRANSKDRAEFYKYMIGNGIMTPNEVREKEDMNPSGDPNADELWMPTGLIPMSKFDEYLKKNQGTPKQIEEEPENKLRLLKLEN
ncbi:MAG TPA: phage portal protein [Alphaproteobacteria bacterium]|nr:phage portal protein [Alphaproteobacteria bacterium]